MKQKSKIAVIGLGNIGTAVATNIVKGNRSVIVADKTIEKANALSQKLGNLALPATIDAAIKEADIIVLAVWFDAIKELFNTYATALQGKIIVEEDRRSGESNREWLSNSHSRGEAGVGIVGDFAVMFNFCRKKLQRV